MSVSSTPGGEGHSIFRPNRKRGLDRKEESSRVEKPVVPFEMLLRESDEHVRAMLGQAPDFIAELIAALRQATGDNQSRVAVQEALRAIDTVAWDDLLRSLNLEEDPEAVISATLLARCVGPDASNDAAVDALEVLRPKIHEALGNDGPVNQWVRLVLAALFRMADAVLVGLLAAVASGASISPDLLRTAASSFVAALRVQAGNVRLEIKRRSGPLHAMATAHDLLGTSLRRLTSFVSACGQGSKQLKLYGEALPPLQNAVAVATQSTRAAVESATWTTRDLYREDLLELQQTLSKLRHLRRLSRRRARRQGANLRTILDQLEIHRPPPQ